MVLSEMGARSLPRNAPLMIIPQISSTLQPMSATNGSMIGATVVTVPVLVPDAAPMMMQITNVIAGMILAERLTCALS